jgi:lambda repressor-like predicted transcriptional regulator
MNSCMSMTKEINRRAAVLRGLERSGLSMAEFCRREELPYSTVAAWRSAQRRQAGRFIEVESSGVPAAAATAEVLCAELVLPGGAVLRVFTRTAEGGAA